MENQLDEEKLKAAIRKQEKESNDHADDRKRGYNSLKARVRLCPALFLPRVILWAVLRGRLLAGK